MAILKWEGGIGLPSGVALFMLALIVAAPLPASEQVLYAFQGPFTGPDGAFPYAGFLVMDQTGNLYGTTSGGGAFGKGSVFELSPTAGTWTETILYSFQGGSDGATPYAGVIFDHLGNLYGTTINGGRGCSNMGCGTIFELRRAVNGVWNETVLYRFQGGSDGEEPFAGLVLDAGGNLYGTTAYGGGCTTAAAGTVFALINSSGIWSEKILHRFCNVDEGYGPSYGSLLLDGKGNVYGTAPAGGSTGFGTAYKLTRATGGTHFEVVHTFTSAAGTAVGGLVLDSAGNLYGAAAGGSNYGAIFKLTPTSAGWEFTTLYAFRGGNDGAGPFPNPVFDQHGNLYGTTYNGGILGNGCFHACGTVYKLSPQNGGGWTETVLHRFGASGDGYNPIAGIVLDTAGNLFGTTYKGGGVGCFQLGCEVVYEITP